MLVQRDIMPPYPEQQPRGEDTVVAAHLRATRPILLVDAPEAYCYIAHGANLWNADHFTMLFDRGTRQFEGQEYEPAISELASVMPIASYEADRVSCSPAR